jgi:cell division protein FtsZ
VKRHQIQYDGDQQVIPEIESQVEAAVAEAISQQPLMQSEWDDDDGVTVEPYIPAAHQSEVDDQITIREVPVPSVYVPSRAERPSGGARMPRTDELPAVARRSLDGAERQSAEPRNARALFRRLASNVGLSWKSEAEEKHDEPNFVEVDDAAARSAIEAGNPRVSRPQAAPAGAPGLLDPHGRPQPLPAARDHVEIPAFLRKHG